MKRALLSIAFASSLAPGARAESCREDLLRLGILSPSNEGQGELFARRYEQLELGLESAYRETRLDRELIERAADPEAPKNKALLEGIFGKLCLGRRSGAAEAALKVSAAARANLARTFMIAASSLGIGQSLDRERPFPFAVAANIAIMIPIYTELACRNSERGIAVSGDAGSKPSKVKAWFRSYASYAAWAVPGSALYTGLVFVEDKARGRDVEASKYIEVGVTSLVWDLGMGAVNVSLLDPLYMRFPDMHAWLQAFFKDKVLVGKFRALSEAGLASLKARDLPGWAAEILSRVTINTTRSSLYLELESRVVDAELARRFSEITGIPVVPAPAKDEEGPSSR
jgi:hypothetical protein